MIKQALIGVLATTLLCSCSRSISDEHKEFWAINNSREWSLKLDDSCRGDWQENWFLDGLIATVDNSDKGMDFVSGPEFRNDAHHAVLWTKESFEGDVKIEYTYTRTDEQTINVNILYIQAQGVGEGVYDKDISKWSDLRTTPTMSIYYKYMNPLHISYAAFPMVNEDPENDYLRVRKYPIDEDVSFHDIEVEPTFFKIGLFKSHIPYKITVIKTDARLFMRVEGDGKRQLYRWDVSDKAKLEEGRIGLRQMYTRAARYNDFKVYTKKAE